MDNITLGVALSIAKNLPDSAASRAEAAQAAAEEAAAEAATRAWGVSTEDTSLVFQEPEGQTEPETHVQGNWVYKIYSGGYFEAWYSQERVQVGAIDEQSGTLYRSALKSLALPSEIYDNYTATIIHAHVNCSQNNYPAWGVLASLYETGINYYVLSGASRTEASRYLLTAYAYGTLTAKQEG